VLQQHDAHSGSGLQRGWLLNVRRALCVFGQRARARIFCKQAVWQAVTEEGNLLVLSRGLLDHGFKA
jgi:hypothetical protein